MARPPRPRRKLTRRRIPRTVVPSFFTLMNLFSGFIAVIQIQQGDYTQACWLIVLAGFFDLLDGMMARLTNSQSQFGVELDSLADVVSFGLAPSFLIYNVALSEMKLLGLFISALPVLCGAVRLARFNITFDGEKKGTFTGLPIPMQAAAIVAIVLNLQAETILLPGITPRALAIVAIVLALLMVSNVPFDAGPRPSASYVKSAPIRSILYLLAAIGTLVWIPEGLLIALVLYLSWGLATAALHLFKAVRSADPAPDDV
jgi:CDP-diacylglycerol--serine O-phosphatidyltransferase